MIETRYFPVDRLSPPCFNVPDKFQPQENVRDAMRYVDKNGRGCSSTHLSTPQTRQEKQPPVDRGLSRRHRDRHRQRPNYFAVRCALAAAVIALCLTPAHAETNNQRAENEARAYFTSCDQKEKDKRALCLGAQKSFMESYILSKTGSTYFFGDLIGYLDPRQFRTSDLDGAETSGIREDRPTACALRYIRWKIAPTPALAAFYKEDWQRSVRRLSEPDAILCKDRVLSIKADMLDHPPVLTRELRAIRDQFAPQEDFAARLVHEANKLAR